MTSETTDVERRENPRTRRVRQLILETAEQVLLERGAHEVTAAIVAEKADVARTTIYRHWPDQRSLLLATIESLTTPHFEVEAEGPLDSDVRLNLERLRSRLVMREVRSVYGALAGHAAHDEAFADGQRLFIGQLVQPLVVVLEAAQGRGELGSKIDCTFEAAQLAAPILHQHLSLQAEITDAMIGEIVTRWLAATTV